MQPPHGVMEAKYIQWPFLARMVAIAAVLLVERVEVSRVPHPWMLLYTSPHLVTSVLLLFAILLAVGYRNLRGWRLELGPVRVKVALLHGVAVGMVAACAAGLTRWGPGGMGGRVLLAGWLAGLVMLPWTAIAAMFRAEEMWRVARRMGRSWAYAGVVWVIMLAAYRGFQDWTWDATSGFSRWMQAATYNGVAGILRQFYSGIVMDVPTRVLGTEKFQVTIASSCSGIEGVALMVLLSTTWIVYRRREVRVLPAVALAGVATGALWVLNLVRLSLLIAIGDAGHPEMALSGFHAEAGWIAYNGVAIGFLVLMERLSWLRKGEAAERGNEEVEGQWRNDAAVYLGPFLAVMAASLVTNAFSSGFEWLYPLRLVAGCAVIWRYRGEYRRMSWKASVLGAVAGVAVGAVWLGADWLLPGRSAGQAVAAGLTQLGWPARMGWLAARMATAVLVVPVAEELAFRGFLARRVMAREFDGIALGSLSWVGVAVSSAVFGVLHGRLWAAGIAAGVVFALLAKRRNSLGDAMVAHGVANLLLGVWVLATGNYGLW